MGRQIIDKAASPDARHESVLWIFGGMALSILGLILHNIREFGFVALGSMETGTIPMVVIGVVLVLVWWQVPRARSLSLILMIAYAVINLAGGGFLSVLPLPFLPFEPEQSLAHYLSHVLYAVLQCPLIWIGFRHLSRKG
jgi:hypothetical protein